MKAYILLVFMFLFILSMESATGYTLSVNYNYIPCIDDHCQSNAEIQNIDNEEVPSEIQLNNLSTLAEIRHAERLLRDQFIGRPSSELIRYLQNRDFLCGSIGLLGRAEINMSCRRSWPGSWFPFSFARSTTIMFRGKTDSVEIINIVAKLDNFL